MQSNWKYSFIDCTKDFIDAIKGDHQPYRSGDDARHVLQIDLAMVASLRSGFRDVRVDSITDGLPENLAEQDENLPDNEKPGNEEMQKES